MKADSDGSSGINRLGFLHVPKNNKSLIELLFYAKFPAKIRDLIQVVCSLNLYYSDKPQMSYLQFT